MTRGDIAAGPVAAGDRRDIMPGSMLGKTTRNLAAASSALGVLLLLATDERICPWLLPPVPIETGHGADPTRGGIPPAEGAAGSHEPDQTDADRPGLRAAVPEEMLLRIGPPSPHSTTAIVCTTAAAAGAPCHGGPDVPPAPAAETSWHLLAGLTPRPGLEAPAGAVDGPRRDPAVGVTILILPPPAA